MSEQQPKLNEKEFLASLGLDDIDLSVAEQQEPQDGQWLLETLDTLSLLRQLGAMVNSKAPVLEPPPEGSSDKPPIVAELLDLLNFSEKNQKNTKEV
ncbi:MAG: hypothetical protein J6T46_13840 [Victivallales bacterium]|nr:hypothetical protein [Victivallales bacterium]MBO7620346.1 hypothetical protein [Victivallales bacterium]